ncbi:MAG: metallophosphoesterase [Planctomycetes bacterium]|nr:metallophosphoesterase [Planctomycetota bacterium]
MPQTIIDLLKKGVKANNADKFRQGNLICLPADGSLVVAGDIHGHQRNFERIVTFADLPNNPNRHVVLQEIIHGGPEDAEGGCLSYKVLFEAVRYKVAFPDQVHIIMANHDTAHITNSKVMKGDKESNHSMRQAIDREFQENSEKVKLAITQFLFSQPLAVRCDNRIWLSHSLPSDRLVNKFDKKVLEKSLKVNDVVRPGSAYLLTWGRKHSQELLDKMAESFDVDTFILGHQPQTEGWNQVGKNLIIIASDHSHGCLISIELEKSYTVEKLIESIVPLASIS